MAGIRLGTRYVCDLPEGYDEQSEITLNDDKIYVAHPDRPALEVDVESGAITPLVVN